MDWYINTSLGKKGEELEDRDIEKVADFFDRKFTMKSDAGMSKDKFIDTVLLNCETADEIIDNVSKYGKYKHQDTFR